MKVRVAVNGYGTIGKRVADAVLKQDDMTLVGVTKTKPNYEAELASRMGIKVYASAADRLKLFDGAGMKVAGTLDDLLGEADVVVDCTPGKVGATYKPLYDSRKIRSIFQGGEKHDLTGLSFNATCNYKDALGKQSVRVVSCNTTGLCRSLYALDSAFGIRKARVVLIRRGADPSEDKKGPINSIAPDPVSIPSHHGPDLQKVLPHIDITTTAFAVPTTLMHVHTLNLELKKNATEKDVIGALSAYRRIKVIDPGEGITSTSEIVEYARDTGRKRYDLPELVVLGASVKSFGNEVYLTQAVHQESIVVPENVDAIRAVAGLAEDPAESMRITDETLGIGRWP